MSAALNKKEKLNNLYYNPEQVARIGKPFNFILSTRSKGKTFGWSRYLIKRFIEKGEQFIYMRRFVDETELGASTFFDEVCNKFKGHTFSLGTISFQVKGESKEKKTTKKASLDVTIFEIDGAVAGYAIPLQRVGKFKSVKFPNVYNIFFDEFLPENQQYIGGKDNSEKDPFLFFGFYSTVARGGGEIFRDGVRCFLCANTISIANPYFLYCNLTSLIRSDSKLIKTDDGYCIQIIKDKGIAEEILKTEAGRALARTAYFGYAYQGDFIEDSHNLIGKPESDGWYVMTITIDSKSYGIRECTNEGVIYISTKTEESCLRRYTLTKKDHSANTIMIKQFSDDPYVKALKNEYKHGNVLFENFACKVAFENAMMM